MEHTNETEKQKCLNCGSPEYDEKKGFCPNCGLRVYAKGELLGGQELLLNACVCPVCGKTEYLVEDTMCKVCGWFNDPVQNDDPDWEGGENMMSLNQAREAYSKGLPIE